MYVRWNPLADLRITVTRDQKPFMRIPIITRYWTSWESSISCTRQWTSWQSIDHEYKTLNQLIDGKVCQQQFCHFLCESCLCSTVMYRSIEKYLMYVDLMFVLETCNLFSCDGRAPNYGGAGLRPAVVKFVVLFHFVRVFHSLPLYSDFEEVVSPTCCISSSEIFVKLWLPVYLLSPKSSARFLCPILSNWWLTTILSHPYVWKKFNPSVPGCQTWLGGNDLMGFCGALR